MWKGRVPLSKCKKRMVYRVHALGFYVGVFDGETGLLGVRHRSGDRMLATEQHYDVGPPNGTVCVLEPLEKLPKDIPLGSDSEALLAFLGGLEAEERMRRQQIWHLWKEKKIKT